MPAPPAPAVTGDGVKVGTFLGNYGRRYYGQGPAPKHLDVLWKVQLGSGMELGQVRAGQAEQVVRAAAGPARPSIVVDGGKTYLVASSYDYNLRKIDAATGKVVWAYKFDDIIKSSPSVFKNPVADGPGRQVHRRRRLAARLPQDDRRPDSLRRCAP